MVKNSSPKPPAPESKAPPGPDLISPDSFAQIDTEQFARNMLSVGIKSQQLIGDFIKRSTDGHQPGPLDPLNISGAFLTLTKAMSGDSETVANTQVQLWKDWMGLWETTARRVLGGVAQPVVAPAPGDRRFRDAEWQQNEIFDFIKQSYLLGANAVQNMVAGLGGIPESERKRIEFYTKQFADALAPTNFPLTNPEVMRATTDLERRKSGQGARQSAERHRARARRAFHPPVRRRLRAGREYRHRPRQGGVPQRIDRTVAVRAIHRTGS